MVRKQLVLCVLFLGGAGLLAAQSRGKAALAVARPVWQLALGASALGLPSVQDGAVVLICGGGTVRAYSEEGKPLWRYATAGRLTPYLSRTPEGMSYICRTNGTLIALNRVGRELWRANLGAPLVAPVLLGWDGRLFAATATGISCYTPSGTRLWTVPLEGGPAGAPTPDKRGGVLVPLAGALLARINAFGLISLVQLPEEPAVLVPLAGDGEEAPVLILYKSGAMEILGSAAYPRPPVLPARPKAAVERQDAEGPPDRVAVTLVDGRVLLLSLLEGAVLWSGHSNLRPEALAEEEAELVMRYSGRGIYALARSGAAGFSEEGERRWFFRLTGASSLSAWSDKGLLFSGGEDWVLYAYRFEEAPPEQPEADGPALETALYNLGGFPPPGDYRFSDGELNAQFSRVNEALGAGRIGEDERAFTRYLMEVSASLRNNPRASATRPPVQVDRRAEAARLLGRFGSVELIPFFIDLFNHDPDPLVKAAAAESIGRIGVDPEGLAMEAFSRALLSPAPLRDPQALIAVAGAIGSLCRFSGPILSMTGTKLLVSLLASDNPSAVRARARLELDLL
jgi:outer membrane protein assembly factor BamB